MHAQKKKAEEGPRSIYLIGDAGDAGEAYSAPVLRLLDEVTKVDTTAAHTLLFLGDNIYEHGLHKKEAPERKQDEANINAQIDAALKFPGRTVFIPGNHDWEQGGRQGWKTVMREGDYITDTLGKKAFLPHDGCPGPEVVELGEHVVLVLIDTQWWLHKHKRPEGERDGCAVASDAGFLAAISDVLKDNRGKHVIIAAHHPLYTYGNHGGYFSLRDHLFPLTNFNKKLWVPLPVIGGLYPWYRALIGNIQDVANVRYKELRLGIEQLLKQYPGTVYAAGHEHNLQYLVRDGFHHVVSGAGCKAGYLQKPNPLAYGERDRGFARITVSADGSLFLDFFTLTSGAVPAWSQRIEGPPADALLQLSDRPRPSLPDSVTVVPNEALHAVGLKQAFFGKLYRDVWTAPIKVPVLRMDTAFGGLKAKATGGGLQTKSLRLKAGNGHEYVARTIKKYPGLALSPEMRGTVVESVVADGIAGSHPYASVAIAPLADAVHVLHTDPHLVFIPDDPLLGLYREEFANTLCLFEERTNGDWSDTPTLGSSKDLVSSADLIAALRRGHDDVLDDRALLRARLLDMLIGDWDRHDDQWRWASYPEADGRTVYRPIPRDRDQAFFKQDGIIPNIVNRKWAIAKFQSYGPDVRDIDGQNFNARYLDRAYLTRLEWSDWKSIADSMRTQLTDDVLASAIHQLPDTAQQLMGARTLAGLKGRRDKLETIAHRQYLRLARYVNVVGTEQNERFIVKRLDDDHTQVQLWRKVKKADDELVYDRTFDRAETKELRLYGIGGNDDFTVEGRVRKAIRVRIIEGAGKAEVVDSARVKSCGDHTIVYGTSGGKKADKKWQLGSDAHLVASKRADAVEYDRQEYVPDVLMPLAALGYNKDDGFFLGGGVRWTKQGFKSEPFKWRHQFTASYAIKTGAYKVVYKGQVNNVLGRAGFGLDAEVLAPQFRFNFFGYGNRSTFPENDGQFQYRMDLVDIQPFCVRTINEIHRFQLGARWFSASQGELSTPLPGRETLKEQGDVDYFGGVLKYTLTNVDRIAEPTRGIRFEATADMLVETHTNDDVQGLKGDLRMYVPLEFGRYRGVLAIRTVAQRRVDDIDPLTAARMGGKEELRGFRRDRFSGNSAAYGNFEVRSNLLSSRNGVLPFRLGLIALADVGRVWVDGADNGAFWHHAFGGGLFISPLNMVVVQGTYAVSDDDQLVDVRLGFFF
ncbi:MAG TPA: BamA/TamA family outer membrane protein [Flavobacteriales bacterium]|nr:BamA/TamA family outer membrane protein [Flavobacteriales bacterium]